MKIAVISDSHLGFGYGTEKEDDSFRQFNEAIEKAIGEKVDLILLPGDIFDSRIPRQEIWGRALEIFQKPLLAEKSGVKPARLLNRGEISPMAFSGIPVIAIHGTHERRGMDSVNPVEMLEKAGFLIHLNFSGVVFEKNGENVCVYGVSGVPENRAKQEFSKPMPPNAGCKNIFVFHQSVAGQVYSDDEEAMLSIEDLPDGFDLYIDGHIHAGTLIAGKKRLLLPGSTIITQQKKNEEKKKGFYIMETSDWSFRFCELESQRPFHYIEINFEKASVDEVIRKARAEIEHIGKEGMKPLVYVKLTGNLQDGKEAINIRDEEITRDYNAIITVSNELHAEDFKKKIQKLRERQQKRLSVDEMGLTLLREALAGTKYEGLPLEELVEELAGGQTDSVMKKVLEKFEKS